MAAVQHIAVTRHSSPYQPSLSSASASPKPGESCEDERCRTSGLNVWHCVDCDSNYCEECWAYQGPHRPGKLGRDGVPHEKTNVNLVARLKDILHPPASSERLRQLHQDDRASKWFGMVRDHTGKPVLEDYGRYASLMGSLQPLDPEKDRFPQLVSFIGTTNAGKSTVIKMLVNHMPNGDAPTQLFPSPIVGSILHDKVPTSGDVHLYADQSTHAGQLPMLYADCEGFEGGEKMPMGALHRRKGDNESQVDPEFAQSRRFPIEWASTDEERRREYAVTELYPRLLYTFSDVVVFVLRNPKTFSSTVLTKLLEWGASALECSLNQPSLPHAIVLLNDSEPAINDKEWDTEHATKSLLSCLTGALDSNEGVPRFRELADHWRKLGVQINSIEDLILRYYSTFKVIRMPRKPHYGLMNRQIGTLHNEIRANCRQSFFSKRLARMVTTSEELNTYLQSAFEHYSKTLSTPFNFVQVSWSLTNPVTFDFGGHLLQLVNSIAALEPTLRRDGARSQWIFDQMSILIASCIMLDCARHRKGQITDLFDKYREYFEWALNEYCEMSLPCSYKTHDGRKCMLVKARHNTKGHQDEQGIMAQGDYCSRFTPERYFERWEQQLRSAIGFVQQEFQDEHAQVEKGGLYLSDQALAQDLHKQYLSEFYRSVASESHVFSHASCFCCLLDVAQHLLPCGHVLCTLCIQSYSIDEGKGVMRLESCPLHSEKTRWEPAHLIHLKPRGAGTRLLCLDGGGIRGIVELEVLRAMEQVLGGEIAIRSFFDLITGTGTGGIIAVALGVQRWPVNQCLDVFTSLCDHAYTSRMSGKALLDLGAVLGHGSKYRTKSFHRALKEAFGQDDFLFGSNSRNVSGPTNKVALTATTSTADRAIVLSNYRRKEQSGAGYEFERPHEPEAEMKIWEACAATSAAPTYFKPFVHPKTNRTYLDGGLLSSNPAWLANQERKAIWPDTADQDPDILLSLGTGQNRISILPKLSSKSADKRVVQSSWQGIAGEKAWSISRLLKPWSNLYSKVDDILDAEIAWATFRADVVEKDKPDRNTRRYIRFNPDIDRTAPAMDAKDQMRSLQMTVRKRLSLPHCVTALQHVSHRLLASSLYFSVKARSVNQDGFHCVSGMINCRFDDGTENLRAFGRYLKRAATSDFHPHLLLKRDNHPDRTEMIDLPIDVIDSMVELATFDMGEIKFTIEHDELPTTINLLFSDYDGLEPQGFALSGFPRVLADDLVPTIMPSLKKVTSLQSARSPFTTPHSRFGRASSESSSLSSGGSANARRIAPDRGQTWTSSAESLSSPGPRHRSNSISGAQGKTSGDSASKSLRELKKSNRFWTYIGPAHMAKYPHLYPPDIVQKFAPATGPIDEAKFVAELDGREVHEAHGGSIMEMVGDSVPPAELPATQLEPQSSPPPNDKPVTEAAAAAAAATDARWVQRLHLKGHDLPATGLETLTEMVMGDERIAMPLRCAPGPAYPPRRPGFDAGELETAMQETLG